MRKSFWCVSVCLVFSAAALSAGKHALNLKRQARVGDTLTYDIAAAFDYKGHSASLRMQQTEKVTKADDSGYDVESTVCACSMKHDGKESAVPAGDATCSSYSPAGALTAIQPSPDDHVTFRKADMLAFVAPDRDVAVGDDWTQQWQADSSKGTPDAVTKYHAEGEEQVSGYDTVKVKFAYKESNGAYPLSSEGYEWVSTKDGSVVKIDAKFKNLPMGDAEVPVSGTFQMQRV